MIPSAHRVVARWAETADTWTLKLTPVGRPLPAPSPGQFNMLYAPGVGEVPISVSGHEGHSVLHTIRDVGPVTHALCSVGLGGVLGMRGPFGTDWGLGDLRGGDVIVVAGGIGLAPLRPVIRELRQRRAEFRRVAVLIGARNPEELIYRDEVRAWQDEAGMDVLVTVDQATRAWSGDVGVVTTLLHRLNVDPEVTAALICGPEVMIRFGVAEVLARGVSPDRVRVSLERSMQCGIGRCGHCQLGPVFVCTDGPVFPWSQVAPLLSRREL